MADSPAADIRFSDLLHVDSRLDAGSDAVLFHGVLEGQGIHDRSQHAHVVCRDAVHAFSRTGQAAPDVAAADDDGDLDAELIDFDDLLGNGFNRFRVDTIPLFASQCFAAQFQYDAMILFRFHKRSASSVGIQVQLENKRTRVGCSLMQSYLACAITSETKSSFRFSRPSPNS